MLIVEKQPITGPPVELVQRIPRILRFGGIGGLCALIQILCLHALVEVGVAPSVANVVTLICCAQLNFALSCRVTWAERRDISSEGQSTWHRLARFNGMVLISGLANQATFMATVPHLNYLIAGVLAIAAGGIVNYTVSDRIVFVEVH